VDGNVSWENIPRMVEAGAEVLVAGSSSLFAKGTTLRENIRRMRRMIEREG
jgi:ribulose-phosphate 3-epimerase